MKTLVPALVLLLAAGCASTATNSNRETGGGATVAGLTTNPKNAPEYVLLSAPTQIREYDFSNAIGVRGLHRARNDDEQGFLSRRRDSGFRQVLC